ncbi:MAG: caspase family protein [Spirochaetales bacterium]
MKISSLAPFGALFLLLVGAVPSLHAADNNRFALVMGNSRYEGDAALANPVNDASDVAKVLKTLGWQVTTVLDGDLRAMNSAVDSFHEELVATKDPTALLFYAGHGAQIGGVNYLIPVSGEFRTANDVTHYAVSVQSILDGFGDAEVATNIIILDACRDNPFGKAGARGLGGNKGLSVINPSANVIGSVVMFSTAPGQTAGDGNGRNGIFTQALLKYLDSDLKLQDLTTRVTAEVRQVTDGQQVPYTSISLSNDFFFAPTELRTSVSPAIVATPAPKIVVSSPREKTRLPTWLQWGGLTAAAVGASVAGYTWVSVPGAVANYNASTDPTQALGLHNQIDTLNVLFKLSLGVASTGVLSGVLGLILAGGDK